MWRHWFSTLNQMAAQMDWELRRRIRVVPIPGRRSIAGEWFLGVPAHSAGPDVGLEIIKLLTSREAEVDRLQAGVGLPTRSSFYRKAWQEGPVQVAISDYFSMDVSELGDLVEGAFCRSDFGCYFALSGMLSAHLQRIIEIPRAEDGRIGDDDLRARIRTIFRNLISQSEFVAPGHDCSDCRFRIRSAIKRSSPPQPLLRRLKPRRLKPGEMQVELIGQYFQRGAISRFVESGTLFDHAGVQVVATEYLSPEKLIALVSVSHQVTGDVDVFLTNPDGQKCVLKKAYSLGDG